MKIYNLLGEEVAMPVSDQLAAGSYQIKFDASHLPSGVYLYRLQAGSFSASRKLVVIR